MKLVGYRVTIQLEGDRQDHHYASYWFQDDALACQQYLEYEFGRCAHVVRIYK